jgi:hypothetical protein
MYQKAKLLYNKYYPKFQVKKPWDNVIIFALNILIAIPIFIIAHQNLINPNWYFELDRILLLIIILAVIQLILRAMRKITLLSVFLYFIALIWGTIFGGYGFNAVFEDYRSMLYTMQDNPNPQDIIIEKLLPFPNKSQILDAIEYQNPKIRNFAIMATTKHFKKFQANEKYRNTIQCFAVFKEINSRWNYVSGPIGYDYIARASESITYLSGNCVGHSILMAACIKSIGGTPRLIHTGGHIYPELLIGTKNDMENVNYLIKKKLFGRQSKKHKLHYHLDERGNIWLNLDYTAHYPGGPFLHEEILGALTL